MRDTLQKNTEAERGCRIQAIYKSQLVIYKQATNNSKNEIKKTVPFTIALKLPRINFNKRSAKHMFCILRNITERN